ncbi:MAG: PaaI family thioesterase [Burkholderiaceae bacterium]|nr:PaaI family thioesterase [Burkholderiaceae bacterium]
MTPIRITSESFEAGRFFDGFSLPPVTRWLAPRFVAHDPASATLRLDYLARQEWGHPGGMVQGGIVTAMMDDTMGPLVLAQTGGRFHPASTDIHTRYFRGLRVGDTCQVEAHLEHAGRSVAFVRAEMVSEDGKLVARATNTVRLIDYIDSSAHAYSVPGNTSSGPC